MFLSIFHCNNRSLSSHFDKLHTKYILLKLTIFFVICKKIPGWFGNWVISFPGYKKYLLKLHKDFEIRTSTFQVFSQTKRVGVTFPFAPSNFWDIGLFTTFSCGKNCSWFLPLFVFRFSLCCFLDLSYISQLFSWQPGPFQADVYKICVSFYI